MKILFFTSTGEIDLSADRAALRHLAELLTRGSGSMAAEIAPDTVVGQTVLTDVRVDTVDGQSVLVAAVPESRSLSIAGARGALKLLADNILALAESNDGGHLHIDFYPDHAYLAEGSAPLVVNSPHGGMPAHGMAVRNSVSLGVFLAVAAHPRVRFTAVELAGRGITADAAGNRWAREVAKPSLDGLSLADKLIERGELEDRLVDLWRTIENVEADPATFETQLAEIVTALEKWPSAPERTLHSVASPTYNPRSRG
ncbi:Imm32 family immunity protein [Planotetraspora mira]|uniref:Uncharacterized protein n=1 Tax=Planotetraspora mira TaxID=58121 RepID=A0A8J3X938_9ACTN|nr:hypothetical protein [Planotetraspora mira]GII31474.1 hypothetical protein Pmi06nite_49160 [Planotetraspora mira]